MGAKELVVSHARALSYSIDATLEEVGKLYSLLAPDALANGTARRLTNGLEDIVQASRVRASTRSLLDVRAEFRELTGVRSPQPPDVRVPDKQDVRKYIDDAVSAAVSAAQNAGDAGAAFIQAQYHADVIVEAETVKAYEDVRRAYYAELVRVDNGQKWTIAKTVRADVPVVALLKRWSAINDKRTCPKCASADGENALLATLGSFSLDGPPAHPRCRCISHLWAVGVKWSDRSMDKIVRMYMPFDTVVDDVETRGIDEDERTVPIVASTNAIDSHGTRVDPSGWDLVRYQRNPIVLFGHDTRSLRSVLGSAENIKTNSKRLEATLRFLPAGINPEADMAFGMFKAKVLKGISVGFQPLEYHTEKSKSGDEILVFDRQELVELSVVPVPSNPEALAKERSMLPPEIAAKLGCETVEAALMKIAEYDLRADAANRELDTVRGELATVKAQLAAFTSAEKEREQKAREAEVDALIAARRLPEAKRAEALQLLAAAPDAFRSIYPQQDPHTELLRDVAPPAPRPQASSPLEGDTSGKNPILELVKQVRSEGKLSSEMEIYAEAYARFVK